MKPTVGHETLDSCNFLQSEQTLTRSWVSTVLREYILSELWEARLSKSLMGMALHMVNMNTTGATEREQGEQF